MSGLLVFQNGLEILGKSVDGLRSPSLLSPVKTMLGRAHSEAFPSINQPQETKRPCQTHPLRENGHDKILG